LNATESLPAAATISHVAALKRKSEIILSAHERVGAGSDCGKAAKDSRLRHMILRSFVPISASRFPSLLKRINT